MLFYPFEYVRTAPDPANTLLQHLRDSYRLLAMESGWDIASLQRS